MKYIIISAIAVLFFANSANSQTTLPDTIKVNTILTKDKSPYLVPKRLVVLLNAKLTIQSGVKVLFATGVSVTINGSLNILGKQGDSVYFDSNVKGQKWNIINTKNANLNVNYLYAHGFTRFFAISGGDSIVFQHCTVLATSGTGDDITAIHDAKYILFDSVYLESSGKLASSKNDGIDMDNIDICIIRNCTISKMTDDAVDVGTGSRYAHIYNNNLSYCNYGVTIGEKSVASIHNNILHHNDGGIECHNGSIVTAANNTIYANTDGITAYHYEEGTTPASGGNITVLNTIFFGNTNKEILKIASSTVAVSYSISAKEKLTGTNNPKCREVISIP